MRCLLIGIVSLLMAHQAAAQPPALSPPPALKLVVNTDKEKGQIIYIDTVIRMVPVVVEREVDVNGQKMKVKVTEYQSVQEQRHVVLDAANSRIIRNDGKQLPIDEVWKLLKKDSVIAVSFGANTPAPAYLQALNPETLIIIPAPMKK
jgi:hypothetical protein